MRYILYLRVSTEKQGRKRSYAPVGLGIESQRQICVAYMKELPVAEYVEVESGKKSDRPELQKALDHCRLTKSTLVVAKLDRLARNVAFVSKLMESDVEFIACDFPQANRLVIHILAAVAEYECALISKRTKDALGVIKQQGIKLGNPNLTDEARAIGRALQQKVFQQYRERIYPIITGIRERRGTFDETANELNQLGIETQRGKPWTADSVRMFVAKGD